MALTFMIIFIVIVFTLFTYFICCYGAAEEKRRNRFQTDYPRNSYENNIVVSPINPSGYRNPNPNNIGFNVQTDGPPRVIPPVGAIPSAPYHYPTPYPPDITPYPIMESNTFPTPETTPSKPTAPIHDNSLPPSYYEATKIGVHKY